MPLLNASFNGSSSVVDCTGVPFAFSVGDSAAGGALAAVCCFLGTLLNLCAVAGLLHFPKTRAHVTTPFVVSLAASDLCFSVIALPMLAIKFFARQVVVEVHCINTG